MRVSEAVASRRAVRGFLDREIAQEVLVELAVDAARAPSGGNLQPWHIDIVHGAAMARLKSIMRETVMRGVNETPAYEVYPEPLSDPYSSRRREVGMALYDTMGIARDDYAARNAWFAENFQFFGAPAAYFCTVDRQMGSPQWADLGMYLQTVMLLASERGLATCPQECWAHYPQTLGEFLGVPPHRTVFCAVAIGYEDETARANRLRTVRAPASEWLRMVE